MKCMHHTKGHCVHDCCLLPSSGRLRWVKRLLTLRGHGAVTLSFSLPWSIYILLVVDWHKSWKFIHKPSEARKLWGCLRLSASLRDEKTQRKDLLDPHMICTELTEVCRVHFAPTHPHDNLITTNIAQPSTAIWMFQSACKIYITRSNLDSFRLG